MPFRQEGSRISVSAEVDEKDWPIVLLGLGVATASAFAQGNPRGWKFIEFLNEVNRGNPRYMPYEIPEDRSLPWKWEHIQVKNPLATN